MCNQACYLLWSALALFVGTNLAVHCAVVTALPLVMTLPAVLTSRQVLSKLFTSVWCAAEYAQRKCAVERFEQSESGAQS